MKEVLDLEWDDRQEGAIKLPPVFKEFIVLLKNIHSHNIRHQNLVYEIKARHPIGRHPIGRT